METWEPGLVRGRDLGKSTWLWPSSSFLVSWGEQPALPAQRWPAMAWSHIKSFLPEMLCLNTDSHRELEPSGKKQVSSEHTGARLRGHNYWNNRGQEPLGPCTAGECGQRRPAGTPHPPGGASFSFRWTRRCFKGAAPLTWQCTPLPPSKEKCWPLQPSSQHTVCLESQLVQNALMASPRSPILC